MLVVVEIYGSNLIKVCEVSDLSVESILDVMNDDSSGPSFFSPDLVDQKEAQIDKWYDLIDLDDIDEEDEDIYDEDGNIMPDADFSSCDTIGTFKVLTGKSVLIEGELY